METERKDKNVKKSLACIHMCSNDHTNAKKWLITRSCDATHVHGGILDLIFDTSNSKTVCSLCCHPTVITFCPSQMLYI